MDLTYLQLVGEPLGESSIAEANLPPAPETTVSVAFVEDVIQTVPLSATDEDPSTLVYDLTSGPAHGLLQPVVSSPPIVGTPALWNYIPFDNYVGPDSFQFSVFDGESTAFDTISFNVAPVNDPPQFNVIADPASVAPGAGVQTIAITGVAPGPLTAFDESSQSVGLTAHVISGFIAGGLSESLTIVPTGDPTVWNLSYNPILTQTAQIQVVANDGQVSNSAFSQSFTVQIAP